MIKHRYVSVEIGSKKYKFFYVQNMKIEGLALYDECKIKLRTRMPEDQHWHSAVHELLHLCLFSMGRDDLSYDEQFVESLSDKIAQAFKTLK